MADEVVFEDIGDAFDSFGITPAGGCADARDTGVGGEADDIAVAQEEMFYFVDFHGGSFIYFWK